MGTREERQKQRRYQQAMAKGASRLHCVARWGDLSELRAQLRGDADVNVRHPRWGTTPLHAAAASSKEPLILALLLEQGAQIDARDAQGETPLHRAASANYPQILAVLLDQGAQIDARDEAGRTPLHGAARSGVIGNTLILLSHGAEVDARDDSGQTPLHLVAKRNMPSGAAALLAAGGDASLVDSAGKRPAELARARTRLVLEGEPHLGDPEEAIRLTEAYLKGFRERATKAGLPLPRAGAALRWSRRAFEKETLNKISELRFDAAAERLATACTKDVRVWSCAEGELLAELEDVLPLGATTRLGFRGELLVVTESWKIMGEEAEDRKRHYDLSAASHVPSPPPSPRATPSPGRWFHGTGDDYSTQLVDLKQEGEVLRTGEVLLSFGRPLCLSVRETDAGLLLAIGTPSGEVGVYELSAPLEEVEWQDWPEEA